MELKMESAADRSNGFAMAVIVEGGLAIIALVFAWIFHVPLRERFPTVGMPLIVAIIRGLLATLPMLAVFWLLVNSESPSLRQLRGQVEWLIREMFPTGSIGQFAMVAILAGVGEELLFRGALQMKIGAWTTPVIGLVIASLLFGLAHALSKLYFLFAVVVGVFLGWLALEYHDLAAPMVAHAMYDFVALVYLSRRLSVTPPIDDESTNC
ncbi:MAG TPA: CPBP family intramembrane glutamic endopeptidase [Lacipirellulaceae bacterium]|nr:CPBP family intramembrane glutamic endopeptidase [Lacipirellulaceae bacterium]